MFHLLSRWSFLLADSLKENPGVRLSGCYGGCHRLQVGKRIILQCWDVVASQTWPWRWKRCRCSASSSGLMVVREDGCNIWKLYFQSVWNIAPEISILKTAFHSVYHNLDTFVPGGPSVSGKTTVQIIISSPLHYWWWHCSWKSEDVNNETLCSDLAAFELPGEGQRRTSKNSNHSSVLDKHLKHQGAPKFSQDL